MTAKKRSAGTVMIVDDEIGVRDSLSDILSDDGFAVLTAENAEAAQEQIGMKPVDMVLLDIWMPPGIDGVALLRRWKENKLLSFPVVMISAHATLDAAVEAMRCGAADILEKPFSSRRLLEVVHKQIAKSRQQLYDPTLYATAIGRSPALTRIKGALMRASSEQTQPVAIIGGSESAPEFFARMLQRQNMPWVTVDNIAEIGENLETLLQQAAGGHIYVRYPDDAPGAADERTLSLLLANAAKHKTRIICEFSHSLDELHAAGKLGAELHRKFSDLKIEVPRLQDYIEDLEAIINLAARHLTGEPGTEDRFSADAVKELIREAGQWQTDGLSRLLGIMRSVLAKSDDAPVDADTVRNLATAATAGLISLGEDVYLLPWRKARETFERQYYVALMRRAKNNYQLAAKMSGLERTYLYRKIRTALGEDGKSDSASGDEAKKSSS